MFPENRPISPAGTGARRQIPSIDDDPDYAEMMSRYVWGLGHDALTPVICVPAGKPRSRIAPMWCCWT